MQSVNWIEAEEESESIKRIGYKQPTNRNKRKTEADGNKETTNPKANNKRLSGCLRQSTIAESKQNNYYNTVPYTVKRSRQTALISFSYLPLCVYIF